MVISQPSTHPFPRHSTRPNWFVWRDDFLINHLQKKKGFLRANVVSCLFQRSTIGNIRFNEALYHDEDYLFLQQFLCRATQIVSVDTAIYLHRKHAQSLTYVLRSDIYISSVLERLNMEATTLLPSIQNTPLLKQNLIRKDTQDFYRRMIRKIVRKAHSQKKAFAELDLIRGAWPKLVAKGIVDKQYLTRYQRIILSFFNQKHYRTIWWLLRLFG